MNCSYKKLVSLSRSFYCLNQKHNPGIAAGIVPGGDVSVCEVRPRSCFPSLQPVSFGEILLVLWGLLLFAFASKMWASLSISCDTVFNPHGSFGF